MAPASQGPEPPRNPERFTAAAGARWGLWSTKLSPNVSVCAQYCNYATIGSPQLVAAGGGGFYAATTVQARLDRSLDAVELDNRIAQAAGRTWDTDIVTMKVTIADVLNGQIVWADHLSWPATDDRLNALTLHGSQLLYTGHGPGDPYAPAANAPYEIWHGGPAYRGNVRDGYLATRRLATSTP